MKTTYKCKLIYRITAFYYQNKNLKYTTDLFYSIKKL